MTLGEKIKTARMALGMTQSDLASSSGISERSIYTYERGGKMPSASNLRKLSASLKVTQAYLSDESCSDPGARAKREAFVADAEERFGKRAGRQAAETLSKAAALFAGGELSEEAKDLFMQALMETFIDSKEKSVEKFTPRRLREGAKTVRKRRSSED